MTKATAPQPPELPTPEALSKGAFREEGVGPGLGAPRRLRSLTGSELDRLLYRELLSPEDHMVLEGFRKDLYKAGLVFSPKSSAVPSQAQGSAQFMADGILLRARRVSDQMDELSKALGLAAFALVVNVVAQDLKVPAGREDVLHKAADILRPMYG